MFRTTVFPFGARLIVLTSDRPESGGQFALRRRCWHGVSATHLGKYLGCPPTGQTLGVNGLDFWRRSGNQFIENWVFVDMLHLFRQFGVDLLRRVSPYAGGSSTI